MPTGQLYPPHKLPGLDQFLTAPEVIRYVTITTEDPQSEYLDIRAETTHPSTHQPLGLTITWEAEDREPVSAVVRIGKHAAPYNEGRVHAADLGLDTGTREGAILWAAFVELREAYRQAIQIRDTYITQFREYAIAKLDQTASSHTRPTKEQATALRTPGGHA